MPQSYTKIYAHLIFSAKNRMPILDGEIRPRVHAYLASAVRNMNSPWVVVGGVEDHVHLLFDMGKLHGAVDFVGEIKRESSQFIKTLGPTYRSFFWQRGYGMFSVSPTHLAAAEKYVACQEEHHKKQSFRDELRGFLKRYGIEFDERYMWD